MDSQRLLCLLSKNYSILNFWEFFQSENLGFLHNMLPPQYSIASLGHDELRENQISLKLITNKHNFSSVI